MLPFKLCHTAADSREKMHAVHATVLKRIIKSFQSNSDRSFQFHLFPVLKRILKSFQFKFD